MAQVLAHLVCLAHQIGASGCLTCLFYLTALLQLSYHSPPFKARLNGFVPQHIPAHRRSLCVRSRGTFPMHLPLAEVPRYLTCTGSLSTLVLGRPGLWVCAHRACIHLDPY